MECHGARQSGRIVSVPTVSLVAEGLREMGVLSPISRRGVIMLNDPVALDHPMGAPL